MTHEVGVADDAEAVAAVITYDVRDKSRKRCDERCDDPKGPAEERDVADELERFLFRADDKEEKYQDVVVVGAASGYGVCDGGGEQKYRQDALFDGVEKDHDADDGKADEEKCNNVHRAFEHASVAEECVIVEHCGRKEEVIERNKIEGVENAVQEVHALNVASDGSYPLAHR